MAMPGEKNGAMGKQQTIEFKWLNEEISHV